MFPLSASINGTIVAQKHLRAPRVPALGAAITVSFADSAMMNASPGVFSTSPATSGVFSICEMPQGATAKITISNVTVGGIDYCLKTPLSNANLLAKDQPLGTIVMTPIDVSFAMLSVLPKVIAPGNALQLNYSADIDTPYSYATLEGRNGTSGSVAASVAVSGAAMTITPAAILKSGASYLLTVYAYGKLGGQAIDTVTMMVSGGDETEVVSSNVLDGNKQAIDGLGLSDSIVFNFRDSVSTASVSVALGTQLISSTTTVAGKSITVRPKTMWLPGQITIAVSATLKDGTPVSFSVAVRTEPGLKFVYSNVYDFVNSVVKNGCGLTDTIIFVTNKTVTSVNAVLIDDATTTAMRTTTAIRHDTIRVAHDQVFRPAASYSISLTATSALNEAASTPVGGISFTTTNNQVFIIASNVLTNDGAGLTNVPVTTIPYYVLSQHFDSTSIGVTWAGLNFVVSTHGDTIFVRPTTDLAYSTTETVQLQGKTRDGLVFTINNNGTKTFTTQASVFVVATNTRDVTGSSTTNFPIYGTMWVKFSEPLNTDASTVIWGSGLSAANVKLYGDLTKNTYNAAVRISGYTLFVTPQRALVSITYGTTVGFIAKVLTVSGKYFSAGTDFKATVANNDLFIASTNAKDNLGNWRIDVGLRDTIMVVSSVKLSAIKALTSPNAGLGGSALPSLALDNLVLSQTGDTIRYIPSVTLTAGTTYSMDFTVTRQDGVASGTTNVLPVKWTTVSGVRITSVNNRQGGLFRPFKVIGDSLVVSFSKAIDTAKTPAAKFISTGTFATHYTVSWSSDLMTATIKNTDTLAAAPFSAVNPYTSGAATQVYAAVTFNLTTRDGEVKTALDLPSGTDHIQIHTEYGLSAVDVNYLKIHDLTAPIVATTAVSGITDSFALNGAIAVVFNRAVDTAVIKADVAQKYFQIYKVATKAAGGAVTNVKLDYALSFSTDAKTISIQPVDTFRSGSYYIVNMAAVPGLGIRYAPSSTGIASGTGAYSIAPYNKTLTNNAFGTIAAPKPATIANLTASMIVDTNTNNAAGNPVAGKRKGVTPAAAVYTNIGYAGATNGIANMNTSSGIYVLINQPAWNSHHSDSVDSYAWRARKITRSGSVGGWYYATTRLADVDWNTGFNASTVNATNAQIRATVNISGETFSSNLTTAENRSGYSNGTVLFNDSNSIEIQVAAVKDLDNSAVAGDQPNEIGQWSSSLKFVDNIAPCDSDFVGAANCGDAAHGGITVGAVSWYDTLQAASIRATVMDEGGYAVVSLTFLKDMDTSTAPSITVWMGDTTADNPTTWTKNVLSSWSNARTYTMVVTVPKTDQYLTDAHAPYYALSVAGMKNASGAVVQNYGTKGDAATGTALGSIVLTAGHGLNAADRGPANVNLLAAF